MTKRRGEATSITLCARNQIFKVLGRYFLSVSRMLWQDLEMCLVALQDADAVFQLRVRVPSRAECFRAFCVRKWSSIAQYSLKLMFIFTVNANVSTTMMTMTNDIAMMLITLASYLYVRMLFCHCCKLGDWSPRFHHRQPHLPVTNHFAILPQIPCASRLKLDIKKAFVNIQPCEKGCA